jgi:hypothetical protein
MNHPGLRTSPAASLTTEGTTWIPIPVVLILVTEAGNILSTGTNVPKYPSNRHLGGGERKRKSVDLMSM